MSTQKLNINTPAQKYFLFFWQSGLIIRKGAIEEVKLLKFYPLLTYAHTLCMSYCHVPFYNYHRNRRLGLTGKLSMSTLDCKTVVT